MNNAALALPRANDALLSPNLWQAILPALRERVNEQNFEIWLSSVRFSRADDRALSLLVPNTFFQEYLSEHYTPVIEEELFRRTQRRYRVEFLVQQREKPPEEPAKEAPASSAKEEAPAPVVALPQTPQSAGLVPGYRFDTFVVGPSNQFAHAACNAVADRPGSTYNPLFLFGGVGLGKTHLLHSIGARILEKNPTLKIRYLSSEDFVNEVINAIRYERVESFHKKYREECDVLLVDDIQFIAGKDRSQTEFFHTFNSLHATNRQIVVTSDKMPQEIPNLELRLKSRLQWGLVADVQPPEMETRVAILKRKADAIGVTLPDDAAIFLATQVATNVRELEGALTRLHAFARSTNRPLALDLARESVRGLESNAPLQLSVESVQRAVCAFYDVKLADLKGSRRSKEIITPRQVAMYLARKLTGASYPEIGARFQKDHATIINAVTKIERLLLTDLPLKHAVDSLAQNLQQGR